VIIQFKTDKEASNAIREAEVEGIVIESDYSECSSTTKTIYNGVLNVNFNT